MKLYFICASLRDVKKPVISAFLITIIVISADVYTWQVDTESESNHSKPQLSEGSCRLRQMALIAAATMETGARCQSSGKCLLASGIEVVSTGPWVNVQRHLAALTGSEERLMDMDSLQNREDKRQVWVLSGGRGAGGGGGGVGLQE